jgi:hypothetical protein
MEGVEALIRHTGLPGVGTIVRCRKTNSLWRVMERAIWRRLEHDPHTDEDLVVPTVYLSFWRIEAGVPPGVGKMLGHLYPLNDDSFEANWEVVVYH